MSVVIENMIKEKQQVITAAEQVVKQAENLKAQGNELIAKANKLLDSIDTNAVKAAIEAIAELEKYKEPVIQQTVVEQPVAIVKPEPVIQQPVVVEAKPEPVNIAKYTNIDPMFLRR